MSNDLIPYSAAAVRSSTQKIVSGEEWPELPAANGPAELNAINRYAYAILVERLEILDPRTVSFLGSCTRANYLSVRQLKWLKDLIKTHLGEQMKIKEAA